jgi:hypothetical protein
MSAVPDKGEGAHLPGRATPTSAVGEVEIRRIIVQGQLGQKSYRGLISTNKLGVVVHTCHPR